MKTQVRLYNPPTQLPSNDYEKPSIVYDGLQSGGSTTTTLFTKHSDGGGDGSATDLADKDIVVPPPLTNNSPSVGKLLAIASTIKSTNPHQLGRPKTVAARPASSLDILDPIVIGPHVVNLELPKSAIAGVASLKNAIAPPLPRNAASSVEKLFEAARDMKLSNNSEPAGGGGELPQVETSINRRKARGKAKSKSKTKAKTAKRRPRGSSEERKVYSKVKTARKRVIRPKKPQSLISDKELTPVRKKGIPVRGPPVHWSAAVDQPQVDPTKDLLEGEAARTKEVEEECETSEDALGRILAIVSQLGVSQEKEEEPAQVGNTNKKEQGKQSSETANLNNNSEGTLSTIYLAQGGPVGIWDAGKMPEMWYEALTGDAECSQESF